MIKELKIPGKVELSPEMQKMAQNLRTVANEIEQGKCNAIAYAAVYLPEDETIHRLHAATFHSENCAGYSLLGVIEKLKIRMVREWLHNEEAQGDD